MNGIVRSIRVGSFCPNYRIKLNNDDFMNMNPEGEMRESLAKTSVNYVYWQQNGQQWADEYRLRRTTTARYCMQELVIASIVDANTPARVLEFGCGVGRHLSYLAQIPEVEIYGVDQSATMLAGMSRFSHDNPAIGRAQLIQPLGSLPFEDGTFDIVYSAEVLVHVRPEDLDSRLTEFVRVCRGSIFHLEPHENYHLAADAHDGCWYHDLVAAYARLGLSARRAGQPVEAQELVVVDLDPARPLRVPSAATLRHFLDVEAALQSGLNRAASLQDQPIRPEPALHTRRLEDEQTAGNRDKQGVMTDDDGKTPRLRVGSADYFPTQHEPTEAIVTIGPKEDALGTPLEPLPPATPQSILPHSGSESATLAARIRNLEPTTRAVTEALLSAMPEAFRARVGEREQELLWQRDRGSLPSDLLQADWVLDWECGDCAFAVALLMAGAKRVVAADSWLDEGRLPEALHSLPGLALAKLNIAEVAAVLAETGEQIDLVFSNTVTEHIQDLPSALTAIRRALRHGGHFFTNHDNYYQPVGSHDHGFLFYGPDNTIVFQGVSCWESADKCAASAEHRVRILRDMSWTMSRDQDATRDPADCRRCFYFRRAQPWAHLLNQSEFGIYFGNESFTTGRRRSTLNKVTLFQLRQFVVEAGMELVHFERHTIANEPPATLLGPPHFFTAEDLKTATATLLARTR